MRIILSDPLSDRFSSYVVCVCNHCRRTNQNRRSMMGLTSNISCVYDAFSSYRISFYSAMSLTMTSLGSGHLVHVLLNFAVVKWWNALVHFLMVKWWNALFHFAMVKWRNSLFCFVVVKCSFLFYDGKMVKYYFQFLWWNGEIIFQTNRSRFQSW